MEIEQAIPVTVQPSQTNISYKTQIQFIDLQRGKKDIVSIQAPSITQFGTLQFLLEDRLLNFPLPIIFSWSTEQLVAVESPKLII